MDEPSPTSTKALTFADQGADPGGCFKTHAVCPGCGVGAVKAPAPTTSKFTPDTLRFKPATASLGEVTTAPCKNKGSSSRSSESLVELAEPALGLTFRGIKLKDGGVLTVVGAGVIVG